MSLPTPIDLLSATKQTEGRSPRTISWYRGLLTRFANLAGQGGEVSSPARGQSRPKEQPALLAVG